MTFHCAWENKLRGAKFKKLLTWNFFIDVEFQRKTCRGKSSFKITQRFCVSNLSQRVMTGFNWVWWKSRSFPTIIKLQVTMRVTMNFFPPRRPRQTFILNLIFHVDSSSTKFLRNLFIGWIREAYKGKKFQQFFSATVKVSSSIKTPQLSTK